MCIHARYLYCVFSSKTHKVNQKSEIFELLLFTTRYNKVACSLIGANLLPGIFRYAQKCRFAYVRIRSHEKHIIAHFIRSMLFSHIYREKLALFCVLSLICYSSPQPQKHKNTQKIIKTQN